MNGSSASVMGVRALNESYVLFRGAILIQKV